MHQIILALDTATRVIGLALYDGIQVISESTWSSQDHHTVELAPAVDATLERNGLKINEIGAIAVSLGPGSFTGLRIGLALAKGLALAQRISLIGIPTLDIIAAAQPVMDMPLAAILQAGRGRIVVGWYEAKDGSWVPTQKIEVTTAEELIEYLETPTMVSGELSEEQRKVLQRKRKIAILASPAQSTRRPSFLAELGWKRWQANDVDDPSSLSPFYIHYNEPIPG